MQIAAHVGWRRTSQAFGLRCINQYRLGYAAITNISKISVDKMVEVSFHSYKISCTVYFAPHHCHSSSQTVETPTIYNNVSYLGNEDGDGEMCSGS